MSGETWLVFLQGCAMFLIATTLVLAFVVAFLWVITWLADR